MSSEENGYANPDVLVSTKWLADNQETWLRCKGGDHVRRIEIAGPPAEEVCEECAKFLGKEFLIARSPDLPLRNCTCARGCQLRYEPVLEHMEE